MAVTRLELVPPPLAKKPARWEDVLIAAAGRYKALKKIADGGTAEIFLGEHVGATGYRRLVAIKRIHAAVAHRPELARMLVEEAHVAQQLNHGNLVEVRDLGDSHGRHFLVLELVDGWTLAQLLERSRKAKVPIPPRVALHIAAEVCRGLAYAHDRGVVHCDICPHNILVSENGEVKLTDFGIARMPARPVPKGLISGKPPYMSPEQAGGLDLDARSDLFSLGTVLYYALTDVLPFKGKDDEELLARVAVGEFESPMKRRPGLPKELGQLLIAAMRPEPWARYQTARELLAAMEIVLRSNARSELERWISELHAADKQVPATRLETSTAKGVPLKLVRTPVTKRTVVGPPRRWLWAALALALLSLGADRAWRWVGIAQAAPAQVLVVVAPELPPAAVPEAAPVEAAQPAVDVEVDEEGVTIDISPDALKVRAKVAGVYDQDRAMVQLDTVPQGADVTIDGRVLGTTPVKLRFRTGIPFEVAFVREGSAPYVKWLTVERPKTGAPRVKFTEPKPR